MHNPRRFPALTLLAGVALLLGLFPGSRTLAQSDATAYRLGPGDQIIITVFGEADLSMTFRLNDTGTLKYPFLGELRIEGLSVAELEQLITEGLKGPYLVNPEVTVSIQEYRPFFVNGQVERPGGFAYQPGLTLAKAIALAGGFTEFAARGKVEVVRGNGSTAKAQRIRLDEPILPGDVITVP